jgi:hypothetical protein
MLKKLLKIYKILLIAAMHILPCSCITYLWRFISSNNVLLCCKAILNDKLELKPLRKIFSELNHTTLTKKSKPQTFVWRQCK